MKLDLIMMCIFCFCGGVIATFLWMRGDVLHYKELYAKVLSEKKKQQVEFNDRLDALGKALEVDTDFMHYGIDNFDSDVVEPSTASEEVLDEEYR